MPPISYWKKQFKKLGWNWDISFVANIQKNVYDLLFN